MFAEFYVWFKLIHVVAAVVFFFLQGVYLLHKAALDKATDFTRFRAALGRFEAHDKLTSLSVLTILLSGLTMVFTLWGWQTAWVNLALTLFLVNLAVVMTIEAPWISAMSKAAEGKTGAVTSEVRALLHSPRITHARNGVMAGDLALVFLMTVKPGLWLALGGAALIVAAYLTFIAYRQNAEQAAAGLAREI